jgi:hypothetical protein
MIVVVEVVNLRTMMTTDVDTEDVGLGGNEHGSDGL